MKKGDVVIMQSDERRRDKWHEGRDGVVRAVKLRAEKTYFERTVNNLYQLDGYGASVQNRPMYSLILEYRCLDRKEMQR